MTIKTTDRKNELGEVYTPPRIVEEMINQIPNKFWADPTKNTFEPTCGNGNFLVGIIKKKLACGQTLLEALGSTYGADIMADNVRESRERLAAFCKKLKTNKQIALQIIANNIRQVNTLEFQDWNDLFTKLEYLTPKELKSVEAEAQRLLAYC